MNCVIHEKIHYILLKQIELAIFPASRNQLSKRLHISFLVHRKLFFDRFSSYQVYLEVNVVVKAIPSLYFLFFLNISFIAVYR